MDRLDKMDKVDKIFLGILIGLVVILIITLYRVIYIEPLLEAKANEYCLERGFDNFKDFASVGIFPQEPIAVKCEYAERYTDLGIQTNQQ